jgi:hypothetical protein
LKTDAIACAVLEEMAKTAPIEIQQQMQDNIQWIKGWKTNWSLAHKPEFYMQMLKAGEIAKLSVRLLLPGNRNRSSRT